MAFNRSFDYVAGEEARILILGSMPGVESLKQARYYAHPRNLFWSLMGEMFGFDPALPYPDRLEQLKRNHIALWDVAHQCEREGSLDSNIKNGSVVANDFASFFKTYRQIETIFFNGGKAAELYRKLVLPGLAEPWRLIECLQLPSTSPAHAALNRKEKLHQWMQVHERVATLKQ